MIKADEYIQVVYGYTKQWQVYCVGNKGPQEIVAFDNPAEAEKFKSALVETIQQAIKDTKSEIVNGIAKEFGLALELYK